MGPRAGCEQPLHDEAAHRGAEDDRGAADRGQRALDVGAVVVEAPGVDEVAPVAAAVPAQRQRVDIVAANQGMKVRIQLAACV
jgi:hypothetical protein